MALAKSGAVRKPPVITRVTSLDFESKCFRALTSAGMAGIEILSRRTKGAAPVSWWDGYVIAWHIAN